MAKFIFCLPRYHTNAAPWVELLKAHGHEAEVLVSFVGSTEYHAATLPRLMPGSRLERFRSRPVEPIDIFPKISAVWNEIKNADPDLVIVRGATRWLSRVAALCAILQGRKLVVYDQEDPVPEASSTWARRAAFRAIGIPHFTSRIGSVDRSSLGSAISIPFARPKWAATCRSRPREASRVPRLLMVAKYRARKGHANLLRALASLTGDHNFSLTLCGEEANASDSAFCQELASLAESLGIRERLGFANNVPHEGMKELYEGHDLFVLPSVEEPAAVSPVEAAWFGCAVLMSNDSGTRGYLPPGMRFEFDPYIVQDIARAIKGMLATKDSLAAGRAECRQYVEHVAGDNIVLSRFEGLLRR